MSLVFRGKFASSIRNSPNGKTNFSQSKQLSIMKNTTKFFATIALAYGLFSNAMAQQEQAPLKVVNVKFQNNSIWFSKVNLITYRPNEKGNDTVILPMMPFGTTQKSYPVGTKVYFANNKQVDIVMDGKRLEDKPFMVVKAEDEGKIFKIN
jgi:hypothetical protein